MSGPLNTLVEILLYYCRLSENMSASKAGLKKKSRFSKNILLLQKIGYDEPCDIMFRATFLSLGLTAALKTAPIFVRYSLVLMFLLYLWCVFAGFSQLFLLLLDRSSWSARRITIPKRVRRQRLFLA